MASQDFQGIKLFGKTITLHGYINTQTTKTEPITTQSAPKTEHMTQTATKTEHITTQSSTKTEDQKQSHVSKSDLMAEKRPDKIIPCPRCMSMETKFCYFNNYNVNQPRHFCRGCQRYWTAGGALRNVPVGAGRRKTKPPGGVFAGDFVGFAGGFGDVSGVNHQVELDGLLVEEWHATVAAAAARGGFRHDFPAKRLRCYSDGQSC